MNEEALRELLEALNKMEKQFHDKFDRLNTYMDTIDKKLDRLESKLSSSKAFINTEKGNSYRTCSDLVDNNTRNNKMDFYIDKLESKVNDLAAELKIIKESKK